jgi:hypothetical protein
LDVTKLKDELAALELVNDEPTAITNLANAWHTYFLDAGPGVPALPGTLEPAKTAMIGALAGLKVPGAGAVALQAGITAYWGIVASSAASIWTLAPPIVAAIPPPTLAGLSVLLAATFVANIVPPPLPKPDAVLAIATVLHTTAGLGGMVALTPPPPGITVPIV